MSHNSDLAQRVKVSNNISEIIGMASGVDYDELDAQNSFLNALKESMNC